MPFTGSGNFSRLMNWVTDAAAKIDIKADRHDQNDDDIANGLSQCITKDGQSSPTADIPMNGKKLINLGDPSVDSDAANKKYVDAINTYSKGVIISGADANGLVKFSSTTGANGLSFTGSDFAWLARLAAPAGPGTPPVPPATLNRLVLNDKPDGTGADVVTINDDGTMLVVKQTASNMEIKPGAGSGLLSWLAADGSATFMSLTTPSGAQGDGVLTVKDKAFTFNVSGQIKAPGALFAGAAYLNTDGNINGSVWGGALSTYIENRASAYANTKVGNTAIQRVALTYSGNVQGAWTSPGGTVIVGYSRENGTSGQVYGLYFMTLQIYDDKNGWRNMGG